MHATSKNRTLILAATSLLIVGSLALRRADAQCGGRWLPTTNRAGLLGNSEVHCMTTWDPDAAGPQSPWLILGGELSQRAGTEIVHSVVGWDGANWQSLGSTPRQVNALLSFNDQLLAGIEYSTQIGQPPSTVQRWNGAAWESLGTLNGSVATLATYNGQLYAGGEFTLASGHPVGYIARWNGSAWEALPGGGTDSRVLALAVFDGQLYAGGQFSVAGDAPAANIARWNGSEWLDVGGGTNNLVSALTVHDGQLVAGGHFAQAGGQSARFVARWNGTVWSNLGGGMTHRVWTLATHGGRLFAGGQFVSADGQPASRIAQWYGDQWNPLDAGTDGVVAALRSYKGRLVVGGYFNSAGGIVTRSIATWNGDWRALAGGFQDGSYDGYVAALTTYRGRVCAGGAFGDADGSAARNLAIWNGVEWAEVLGGARHSGGTGAVTSLATYSMPGIPPRTNLIVGGIFQYVGGEPGDLFHVDASNIAEYSESLGAARWSALGSGLSMTGGSSVSAVAEYAGQIIAGGVFQSAGGASANSIAAWNRVRWQPLGDGMASPDFTPTVEALTVYNGQLIAAGAFQTAGGVTVNSIARWNGSSWQSLGTGIRYGAYSGAVYALAVFNGELIAAGVFSSAGGVPVNNIARWNGTNWASLGSGLEREFSTHVAALAMYNGDLIAGGRFSTAGGVAASHIARWNGADWRPLGTGITDGNSNYVKSLTVCNGELIVGGRFASAGGLPSTNWARWTDTNKPWIALQPSPQSKSCGGSVSFSATPALGYDEVTYRWRRNGVFLVDGPTAAGAMISGATTSMLTITNLGAANAGQYDVVITNACGGDTSSPAALTVTGCRPRGDLNCDEHIDNFDVDPFVLAISSPDAYTVAFPNCDIGNADANADGAVNNFDVDAFILLLTGG